MKKLAALSLALAAGAASASAIHIQTGTYTGAGLFSDPASFQSTVDSVVTTSAWLSSANDMAVTINNGALEETIGFAVAAGGSDWTFRSGVDFGKGGAIYLDGVLQQSYSHDMWWGGSYTGNTAGSEQFFQFTANGLSAGGHTLTIYGLEDCCSGNQQTQYQIGTGTFTSFGAADGLPAVPEAQNFAMLLAGLGLVGTLARRRSNKQA